MKKKTIELKSYKKALKTFKEGSNKFGLCYELGIYLGSEQFRRVYPVLYSLKPESNCEFIGSTGVINRMYWFPLTQEGHQRRIELLEKAIKLMS